jgi:hypothetical protein
MTDVFLQGWKAQLDAALRLAETVTEAAMRMHEVQLEAAAQAHADAEATRNAIGAATDFGQAMKITTEWARGNAAKSLQYWRALFQASTPEEASTNPWLGVLQQFSKPLEKTKT